MGVEMHLLRRDCRSGDFGESPISEKGIFTQYNEPEEVILNSGHPSAPRRPEVLGLPSAPAWTEGSACLPCLPAGTRQAGIGPFDLAQGKL